jgi:hypothetical protein
LHEFAESGAVDIAHVAYVKDDSRVARLDQATHPCGEMRRAWLAHRNVPIQHQDNSVAGRSFAYGHRCFQKTSAP